MKSLNEILRDIQPETVIGSKESIISQIHFDSRKVKPGSLFVATRGTTVDGHAFIEKAISSGAIAIICEALPEQLKKDVTYVQVADSAEALGWAASLLAQNSENQHPSKTRRPPKCLKLVILGSAQKAETKNFGVHFNAFLPRKVCLKRA